MKPKSDMKPICKIPQVSNYSFGLMTATVGCLTRAGKTVQADEFMELACQVWSYEAMVTLCQKYVKLDISYQT